MKTYEIKNKKDFNSLSNFLKIKSMFSFLETNDEVEFLGIKFGHKSGANQKYDWLNKHFTINYHGKTFDVKTPTPVGRGIHYFRPIIEEEFNDGFLKRQSISEAYKNEIRTIKKLNEHGIITPSVNEYLITGNKNILVTEKDEEDIVLLDQVSKFNQERSTDNLRQIVKKSFEKLNEIHSQGVIWGDAWLGNFLIDKNHNLKPKGFSFQANREDLSFYELCAKDYMHLYFSSVFRTDLLNAEVAWYSIEGYKPDVFIESYLIKESAKKATSKGTKKFFKPIFGLDEEQVNRARESLITHL